MKAVSSPALLLPNYPQKYVHKGCDWLRVGGRQDFRVRAPHLTEMNVMR